MILTIDTGTTNTRINLFNEYKLQSTVKVGTGVRDTAAEGDNSKLKAAIKKGIFDILNTNNLLEKDIEIILASGMIGSELGLVNIPHVLAPIRLEQLSKYAQKVAISDITDIPFLFIPGVKNNCDYSDISLLNDMDIMRGEETEFFGICKLKSISDSTITVLPGSHTKIVVSDDKGNILSCHTTLSGELISCISTNTILKGSLPADLLNPINDEYLKKGYLYSREHGLNKALFKVRIMKNFLEITDSQLTSFFVGIVLRNDIDLICKLAQNSTIIIGGSNPLKTAFAILISFAAENQIIILNDEETSLSTSVGAIEIYKSFIL